MRRSKWETRPVEGSNSGAALLQRTGEAARIWSGVADLQDFRQFDARVFGEKTDEILDPIVAQLVSRPGANMHTNFAGVERLLQPSDDLTLKRASIARHLATYLAGLKRGIDFSAVEGHRFELTVHETGAVLAQKLDWSRVQGLHTVASGRATDLMPLKPGGSVEGEIVAMGSVPPMGGALIADRYLGWRHMALAHLVDPIDGAPQADLEIFAPKT